LFYLCGKKEFCKPCELLHSVDADLIRLVIAAGMWPCQKDHATRVDPSQENFERLDNKVVKQ